MPTNANNGGTINAAVDGLFGLFERGVSIYSDLQSAKNAGKETILTPAQETEISEGASPNQQQVTPPTSVLSSSFWTAKNVAITGGVLLGSGLVVYLIARGGK